MPYDEGNTPKNEANLLDIFVQQRWNSLNAEERGKLAEEARKAAAGKISDAPLVETAGVMILLGRLPFGPIAWIGLGINNMLDAAFKVTVPCVLHIAYLRRKIREEWQKTAAASGTRLLPAATNTTQTQRPSVLAIAGEDGEQVLSLARIPQVSGGKWHEIGSSEDGISRLNPLLQSVLSLGIAAEVATTHYMEVVCNGPLLAAKKGGGLRAMSYVNGTVNHANLFEPDKLAAMVNASALMNVASIVLAQKHLADISKKLSEIKQGIDAIRKHQKNERQSQMTGSIRYYEQIAPSILEGDLSDELVQQIERGENEFLRIQDHVMEDIRSATDEIRSLKDDEWFGSDGVKRAIEEQQKLLADRYRELILCIRARACGWQLLCVFPGREKRKEERRRDIQKSISGLDIYGDMLSKTDELLRKKIHEIFSFWNKTSTVNERNLALLQANETLLADVSTCRNGVLKDLRAADEMLAATKRPVAMVVRIEDSRIVAIRAS